MNSRLAACGASTLVALSVMPPSVAVDSAPVAPGKNLLPTTPQAATMNRLNTGALSAAQAERSGKPSKNGKPMATAPARRKARRFTGLRRVNGSGLRELPSGVERS
jgi:hypothetical protein